MRVCITRHLRNHLACEQLLLDLSCNGASGGQWQMRLLAFEFELDQTERQTLQVDASTVRARGERRTQTDTIS